MKIVVGNHKAYLDSDAMDKFLLDIGALNSNNVIICPSFIYLDRFKDKNILLGSQTVSNYEIKATTGELSAEQLKSAGVDFSIVGHSERRQLLHESIDDTNIKIKQLLKNKMIPILCIGETKEEKDKGITKDIITKELEGAFKELSLELIEKVIIAYEPIWAIGTGITPTNDEIEDVVKYIRDYLNDSYRVANIILYGGSVNSANIDELNKLSIIDGYLIGGASTKADEFKEIINKCK